MILNDSLAPGERWYGSPELHTDAVRELAEYVCYLVNNQDFATLAGRPKGGPNRFETVAVETTSDLVVRDTATGLYLKGTTPQESLVQAMSMNYLHKKLAVSELGIAAVRYLYMFIPKNRMPTLSISEAAKGTSLQDIILELAFGESTVNEVPTHAVADRVVRERLAAALPEGALEFIANDLNPDNVFYDRITSTYTVIDQPGPDEDDEVIAWLERQPDFIA